MLELKTKTKKNDQNRSVLTSVGLLISRDLYSTKDDDNFSEIWKG